MLLFILLACFKLSCQVNNTYTGLCNSPIYCQGPILDKIQTMQIFNDSKTFVDMPTSSPIDQVYPELLSLVNSPNLTKEDLKKYINDNFLEAGSEVEKADLLNFNVAPMFLQDIKDLFLRSFAVEIVKIWPSLFRKFNPSKLCAGCVTSLLPTKYPFIVPGGRFNEFYYFDTFFEIEGLLISELYDTTKNMIEDLLEFVRKYGFVPNGSRIYYLNRSQPPFLTQMVKTYFNKTKNTAFVLDNLETLDKEYMYWIKTHSVQVPCDNTMNSCNLTRFYSPVNTPRPESYDEDMKLYNSAKSLNQEQKAVLYNNLISGAESGWDYSSRWTTLKINATIKESNKALMTINTINIVPVDLNSVMYKNEITLSEFHQIAMNFTTNNKTMYDYHKKQSKKYLRNAANRAELMEQLLYDKKDKQFYDYDLSSSKLNRHFSTASFTPFWADALTPKFKQNIKNYITPFSSIERILDQHYYGLPVTDISSGLQWDYPNMWAPTIYLTVEALLNSFNSANELIETKDEDNVGTAESDVIGTKNLRNLALRLANSYIQSVYCSWYKTGGKLPNISQKFSNASSEDNGLIYEKYNVELLGEAGGGGEYQIQTGFGWTNGVAIYLIDQFDNELKLPTFDQCAAGSTPK